MTTPSQTLPTLRSTPGPWELLSEQMVYGPERQLIAKVAIGSGKDGNGPLIAAAPELLIALRTLIKAIADLEVAMDSVTGQFAREWTAINTACTEALGALLKATLPPLNPQP